MIAGVAVPGVADFVLNLRQKTMRQYPWFVINAANLVEPSVWMGHHLPKGSVIATKRIGCLAYYSGMNIFDYKFGLTDKLVATLVKANRRRFEDPSSDALHEVWRIRKPLYFLEDGAVVDDLRSRNAGRVLIHGMEYVPVKSFQIADGVDWVLCASLDGPGRPAENP